MKRSALHRVELALVTIVAASIVAVGAAAPAAAATTVYTASIGFSGAQGQNQWSYQKSTGSTYSDLGTYTSGTARWSQTADYPWVSADQMHPDTTYAAVRKWIAPAAGTVTITGTVHKGDAVGDGVAASIRKNSTVLWSQTVTDTTDVTPTGVGSVNVAAGDAIYFVADKNGDMGNDHTFWNPVVTFTDNAGQPANSLSVVAYGATPDDASDDLDEFNAAIAAAKAQGKTVWVPAGTFRLNNILQLDGVKLAGAGQNATTLLSTDPNLGTIRLTGDNTWISFLKHEYQTAGPRDGFTSTTSIFADGATNFRVEGVWVHKAQSAGIFVYNSSSGVVAGNKVQDTNADAIHMTNGSHHVTVSNNYVSGVGDDTIAVVSYQDDVAATHHITIQNNDVGYNSLARGISVVGGEDVTISGNTINNTQYAGIYISVEAEWNTRNTLRVALSGNTVDHCALNTGSGHPNVLVYGSQGTLDEITFNNNLVKNSAGRGIGVWGDGDIGDVYFNSNTVQNSAGAATQFDEGTIHLNGNIGF